MILIIILLGVLVSILQGFFVGLGFWIVDAVLPYYQFGFWENIGLGLGLSLIAGAFQQVPTKE